MSKKNGYAQESDDVRILSGLSKCAWSAPNRTASMSASAEDLIWRFAGFAVKWRAERRRLRVV